MRALDRMVIGLVVRSCLSSLAVLVGLFLLVDFLEAAKNLFGGEAGIGDVLLLYACKLPSLLHLMLPVALVVGSCAAFALLGRHQEIRALAAAGIAPRRIAAPVVAVGLVVVLGVGLLAEFGVPPASDAMEGIMRERFGRIDSTWRFFRNHMWVQGDENRLFRIARKSDDGQRLEHVIVLELDDAFHALARYDMRRAEWRSGRWIGTRVDERKFDAGRLVSYSRDAQRELNWSEKPDRFRDLSGRPKQKDLASLSATIEQLERRGLNAAEYRLEWHNRFAYPLLGLALLGIALPWLVRPARRRTLAQALLEASGLVFVGFLMVSLSVSSVSGGLVAAWIGAWAPFGLLSLAVALSWFIFTRGAKQGRA